MYKVKNNKLPRDIQELFELRFGPNGRRPWTFRKPVTRTNIKSHCISCKGVQQWNGISESLRCCEPWSALKRKFKQLIIEQYKLENWYVMCTVWFKYVFYHLSSYSNLFLFILFNSTYLFILIYFLITIVFCNVFSFCLLMATGQFL